MMTAAINKTKIDNNYVPFGKMKRETLLEGRKLLTALGYGA